MKLNFRKISAIAASAVMTISSIGFAAAGAYPYPFVSGGSSDVAIVYGTGAGVSSLDIIQAGNIQTDLQASMGGTTTTTSGSVSGEAYELFTSSTKVYINDSLNAVRSVLTDTELPTVLEDQSFSGNVDASMTQTITLGTVYSTRDDNLITFKKQPTSDDDPNIALTIGTSRTDPLYNASITFNKAVNLTHADSEGEDITLFGQKFTIGSATTDTSLVLLKEAEKVSLDSDNPTADVTVGGATYTIELVSASDTAATIRVTDSSGSSDSAEINEAASKKVNGLTVAVNTADETNLKLSATIIAGADKVTLTDSSAITIGEEDTVLDGTHVEFEPNGRTDDITKLVVSVFSADTDEDAIKAGESFVDPVFGSFKLDFAGLNIADDDTSSREEIVVEASGDDRMSITFTDHRGEDLSGFQFARNSTQKIELQQDTVGERNISVKEAEIVHVNDYVVVGNEDNGYLLKVSTISNATSGYSSDSVKFTDVISGDSYTTTITSDGAGTVTIGGQVFDVTYAALSGVDQKNVTLNAQDSTGENMNVFGTIQTSKGALVMFYKPLLNFSLSSWDDTASNSTGHMLDSAGNDLAGIRIPDGDGYTTVSVASSLGGNGNWTINDGSAHYLNTSSIIAEAAVTLTIGQMTFNLTSAAEAANRDVNRSNLYLVDPEAKANVLDPAIVIIEEKDDNSEYHAQIIKLESGATSDDGIGVDDAVRTWGIDNVWESTTMASDTKMQQEADLWGTITTLDTSDSDQNALTVSYPDEQVYAQIYMAEESASISAGTSSSGESTPLGEVLVKDSEVSSVSTKNLIVIGGSCINSAAATLVGSGACTADFTTATGVGSGEFLIESFGDSTLTSKIALLVAGYDAADTVNAAKYLTTQTVTTDAGTKYKGTSSTSASLVTEETTTE